MTVLRIIPKLGDYILSPEQLVGFYWNDVFVDQIRLISIKSRAVEPIYSPSLQNQKPYVILNTMWTDLVYDKWTAIAKLTRDSDFSYARGDVVFESDDFSFALNDALVMFPDKRYESGGWWSISIQTFAF